MARTLFTDVNVIDGSGAAPYRGQVLVEEERIVAVAPAQIPLAAEGARHLRGAGATLMPGLVESHAHLSFIDIVMATDLGTIPPEEHTLQTARSARTLLDHGFTSCFSAASAKPRLDVAVRNAIRAGELAGPRLLAASPELTVTSGLGDARRWHIYQESFALVCNGAEEFTRVARSFCREDVDTLKINPSGDTFVPHSRSRQTVMTDAEVAAVCNVAHAHGKRVAAHARSAAAIKLALRHGVEVIYHANFADEEACDLLESAKERVFVAPTLGATLATLTHAADFGRARDPRERAALEQELVEGIEIAKALKRRGVRVLPGGDYGFAWNRNGSNARDLQVFVELLGFTPMEAIVAATRLGGELMQRGRELGQIRPGYLADLLLVDGDPLADITILQDSRRLICIMQDGVLHKHMGGDA